MATKNAVELLVEELRNVAPRDSGYAELCNRAADVIHSQHWWNKHMKPVYEAAMNCSGNEPSLSALWRAVETAQKQLEQEMKEGGSDGN